MIRSIALALVCASSIGCMAAEEDLGEATQLATVPDGLACYVDTNALDPLTPNRCSSAAGSGPSQTVAVFETSSTFLALLNSGSYTFSWSDSRCGSSPEFCVLPIRVGLANRVTLTARLLQNGVVVYEASATARYL